MKTDYFGRAVCYFVVKEHLKNNLEHISHAGKWKRCLKGGRISINLELFFYFAIQKVNENKKKTRKISIITLIKYIMGIPYERHFKKER